MLINNPVITGSFIVNGTNFITNTPSTGSNTFNGNQIISGSAIVTGSLQVTGSITTTGTITAQTLVVSTISSSIEYASGSNIFGSSLSNRQQMTGSVSVTGSFAVTTTGTELQVGATGVTLGNALTDIHNVTGSLRVTGSLSTTGAGTFSNTLTAFNTFTLDGTKKIFLRSNQGTGGGLISGSAIGAMGNFSIYSDDGIAGDILGMYYWNGGAYRSALQVANVSSGNSNLILMKDGGNVGIGTTLVSAKLVVVGGTSTFGSSTSDYTIALQDPTSMAEGVGGSILLQGYKTGTAAIGNFAYVAGRKENGTSGNEAGCLSFGTFNSSGIPGERWRVTSGGILASNGNSTENSGGFDKFSLGYSNSNYGWIQSWGGTVMYLNRLGNAVYAGTQRIDNNSDERIKENISPISNALNTVLALNGRKFNMLDEDNVLRYGFVAQEVQPYLSDFVKESDRSFEKGDVKIENLLTLESSGAAWSALLVEAIKEQQAQIEVLKTEIETLKNK